MQSFSIQDMWMSMGLLAKGVVIVLGLMSMLSLSVIVERLYVLFRARRHSVAYVSELRPLLERAELGQAAASARSHPYSPVAKVVGAGISEFMSGAGKTQKIDLVDAVARLLERLKEREIQDLRRGLGTLATVASSAPFVGLFGTVVGIINAFRSMAATNSGGLASVSAGIAEALVTTAFGLLVAIPAVWMFNYLQGRIESFLVDINDISSELVDYLIKTSAARSESGGS